MSNFEVPTPTYNADAVAKMAADAASRSNIYTVIGSMDDPKACIALEASNDNVFILEDDFRTGYECKTCDGDCYIADEKCAWCKGSGTESDEQTPCRVCCASHIEYKQPGDKVCPDCNGKGGLLVAPQDAERRPTTGVITSIGPQVQGFKPGDRVLYSLFSGQAINFKQKQCIRYMHEHEIIGKIHGLGKIGDKVSYR